MAIAEIDTRKLTRILRDKGAQAGCIVTGDATSDPTWPSRPRANFPA